MNAKRRRSQLLTAALGLWVTAAPALAQKVTEVTLRRNPYRDVGGSCVYGRSGELVHTPKGETCPTRHDAPGGRAASAEEDFAGLPPELKREANALMSSHEHVASDLVELRRAIGVADRDKALKLTDEMVRELVDHLAQEQALFDKLGAEHQTH